MRRRRPNLRALRSELLRLGQGLDDPARVELLLKLTKGPRHVEALASGASLSRPTISHHLAVLKRAGMVTSVRQGRTAVYSADLVRIRAVLHDVLDALDAFS